MEDQVFSLRQKGATCYFINGSISAQQRSEIIDIFTYNDVEYALLITGPELVTDEQLKDCLKVLHTQDTCTLLSVNEANCIDLLGGGGGGRSFLEKYSKLDFLKNYNVPILALTGTATDRTVSIVTNSLGLDNPVITKMSFARSNLELSVIRKNNQDLEDSAHVSDWGGHVFSLPCLLLKNVNHLYT